MRKKRLTLPTLLCKPPNEDVAKIREQTDDNIGFEARTTLTRGVDTLVLESITLRLSVKVMIKVFVDLLRLPVFAT